MKRNHRAWRVPEVLQASAMDCGPAVVHALLAGHGIDHPLDALRDACRTTRDGTSIDDLEEVSIELGLDAEQVMIPPEHVVLDEAQALPAIVVTVNDAGYTHFIVVWRRVGPFLQIMDPADGRRWIPASRLRERLFVHEMEVPAEDLTGWIRSEENVAPLGRRLRDLGLRASERDRLLSTASSGSGWDGVARLDAACRLTDRMVAAGALRRGREASGTLSALLESGASARVPAFLWTARPAADDAPDTVLLRGAVVLRVRGRRPDATGSTSSADPSDAGAGSPRDRGPLRVLLARLSAEPAALRGRIAAGIVIASSAVILEALLLLGLIELLPVLDRPLHRGVAVGTVGVLAVVLLLLELTLGRDVLSLGRRLEVGLRRALYDKLGRLDVGYVESRLPSDLVERSHQLYKVRALPELVVALGRSVATLAVLGLALVVLAPWTAPFVALAVAGAVLVPAVLRPMLAELDLRLRTRAAALGRFHLDALVGLLPVRAHGAENVLRSRHDVRTADWARALLERERASMLVIGASALLGYGAAAALLVSYARGASAGDPAALLFVYWALQLPDTGAVLAETVRSLAEHRSAFVRILEPLSAREAEVDVGMPVPTKGPIGVRLEGASVTRGGMPVLTDLDLELPRGQHLAILGRSGAGKSTLVSVLLGLVPTSSGRIVLEGQPDAVTLRHLRARMAWIAPDVRLWNRSIYENVGYGSRADATAITEALAAVRLDGVVDRLPGGLRGRIGENGRLLSGGEAQRVRIARSLVRDDVGLALLDEAFRGLDPDLRAHCLDRVRSRWRDATLVHVTHLPHEAMAFDRVLVLDAGRIVEDGAPATLAARSDGHLARYLAESDAVDAALSASRGWAPMVLEDGRIRVGDDG